MGSQREGGSLIPHKPMCTLYRCPSIPQTPFPRGLMSTADLLDPIALLYLEPRFNFFANTTCAVNMPHLHSASSGGLSPLPCERTTGVLRHCTVPGKEALQHHCPSEAGVRRDVTDTLCLPRCDSGELMLVCCRAQYNQVGCNQVKSL